MECIELKKSAANCEEENKQSKAKHLLIILHIHAGLFNLWMKKEKSQKHY